jgi:hypothetical protein
MIMPAAAYAEETVLLAGGAVSHGHFLTCHRLR